MRVDKVRIYISTVKEQDKVFPEEYKVVNAGSEINPFIKADLKDNSLENISDKNKSYCELTVLYWIWKNSDCTINGLVHHRRFFFNKRILPQILSGDEVAEILSLKEIVIPKPVYVGESVEAQYRQCHIGKDYDLCREIIRENYREYLEAFEISSMRRYLYPYNMLITRKDILNDYCSFLFPILEKLEEKIDISERDVYQQRVFGFLGERLFQTWLIKNSSLDTVEFPVYNVDSSIIKQKVKEIIR